jgi:hypothetical protein
MGGNTAVAHANVTLLLLPVLLLLRQVENALQVEGQRIPNLTHPDVPAGGEENATVMSLVRRRCCYYCLCYHLLVLLLPLTVASLARIAWNVIGGSLLSHTTSNVAGSG